jgi:hypothetical protein
VSKKIGRKKNALTNVDVVISAAYKLNAQFNYIHTEDIAIIANEIAPGRFSWEKYKENIDLENVRKRLFDARNDEGGGYVKGNNKDGWLLTLVGVEYAEKLSKQLKNVDLSRIKISGEEKRQSEWAKREKLRILSSDVFKKYQIGGAESISKREAENLFKIDEYITGQSRTRKVDRLAKIFSGDVELAEVISILAIKVLGD